MTRTSLSDPIEKFRFIVFALREPDINILSEELTAKALPIFLRGGFSEVSLPNMVVNPIEYKDNLHYNITYHPGIARCQPMELRRGMTYHTDLYNWFRQVHDHEAQIMSSFLTKSDEKPLADDNLFRRTLFLFALGRKPSGGDAATEALKRAAIKAASGGIGGFTSVNSGAATAIKAASTYLLTEFDITLVEKVWIIFNAFPISYRSGDSLLANNDSEKLIESVNIQYESFVELL